MTASGDIIRAFIATAISPMAREALEDTIGRLRQEIPGGVTWVRPEGIHLTLKFLGNVRRDESERLMSVVGELAAGHGPFTLGLSGLGMFPNGRRPRVLWAGLTGDWGPWHPCNRRWRMPLPASDCLPKRGLSVLI